MAPPPHPGRIRQTRDIISAFRVVTDRTYRSAHEKFLEGGNTRVLLTRPLPLRPPRHPTRTRTCPTSQVAGTLLFVVMSLRAGVKKRTKGGEGAASASASGAASKSEDEDESYDQDEGGSKYSRLTLMEEVLLLGIKDREG